MLLESPAAPVEPGTDTSIGGELGVSTATAAPAPSAMSRFAPWVVAAVAVGFAAWAWIASAPEVAGSYELAVAAPGDSEFLLGTNSGNAIISPDGTKIAFVATTEERPLLWVRRLDRDEPFALPGTENPQYPFWSADSTQLAFFSQSGLKKVDISGGLPETLAEAPNGR